MNSYQTSKWEWVALEDAVEICDYLRKPVNSKERAQRVANKREDELYPYYGATGQVGYIDSYLSDGEYVLLGEDGAPFLDPFAKKAYLIKGKGWVNNHAHVLKSKLNNKFLCYYLNQVDYNGLVTGTTRYKLTQAAMKRILVPTPDLVEQERIVSKIEELFSKLDASVAELKTAKEKLKVYRQAVLKEALTPEQGWCKCCFSDLMESVRNGYGKKPDDMGEYRILRISSVRPGKVELSDFRCNQTPFKEDDLISENDLLFTRYNGSLEYVGVCACVPQLQEKYAYPDKIIKCTPKLKNSYHSRFLQYSMNQGEARKYIRSKIKTTSGQKGIAGSDIKKVVLWLPELPVQEKIVKMIDEKMSTCDNIEQTIDISLRQAEAMRQSILKHAFKGGL